MSTSFIEQNGTIEDAELTVTPDKPEHPDVKKAMDYVRTLPEQLRGRELAERVVYIAETFPQFHDQRVSCSLNSACLVGWTEVLGAEPISNPIAFISAGNSLADVAWGRNFTHEPDGVEEVNFAAELLGIDGYDEVHKLESYVYNEPDAETAISNFKILTGLDQGWLVHSDAWCDI